MPIFHFMRQNIGWLMKLSIASPSVSPAQQRRCQYTPPSASRERPPVLLGFRRISQDNAGPFIPVVAGTPHFAAPFNAGAAATLHTATGEVGEVYNQPAVTTAGLENGQKKRAKNPAQKSGCPSMLLSLAELCTCPSNDQDGRA
jgi:hypothetical protein